MNDKYKERTKIVIGQDGIDLLRNANILVFGIGGVGSYVVEGLVRAGIGNLTIVDFDTVDITNINRQIPALHSTIGMNKTDVLEKRIKDINPEINLKCHTSLYNEDTSDTLLDGDYDFVVDAIDMVPSKIHLIESCYKRGLNIISSMGMGNKLDPTMIEIADIHKTEMCPLAKIIRREAKNRGIKKLPVVYSREKPRDTGITQEDGRTKRVNGSMSFVPSCAGLIISSYIVRKIIGDL
ncbi:ThiF family adenylyltransferase [Peptostreptococcus anaerobius]|jgi:tRNA A37 threonylcarbamoyladenosine dehydratase|uniref:ThiF family protein n=1 Tax=Peptostreptococcus anaerobius TaxID=1261 RepID=A0A135YWF7_9FIRM|nr:tRNA threonylcarbamoyladenosine dehydratase [Peptostreptococcus anaerobius]KXI13722.1 ThiF family protein [Peptostreptococcus anaerobius]MDB8849561.1 tRNA threonylcarbamoyladenosine dehydratase [Peptostreptococcus anaerobius]MDB8853261.1 tRNA threonylcarbamoyladenosine dehydratase [Peptostreptococcus anaerobius]MDB8855189.1 tRNA threonylcarbamoyladenosine dehydratase [Peptostreptococcus anaerobius]MDU0964939.1 tRNA threonylcarbamoyladenosine dehydratase [Peptostreptococcus anaerobius]